MNKLILLIGLTISLQGFAQNFRKDLSDTIPVPFKNGKITYIQIDSTFRNVSKDVMYSKAKLWVVKSFGASRQVLQADDKEMGLITGVGGMGTTLSFNFEIAVRDNKYRLTIDNIIHTDRTTMEQDHEWSKQRGILYKSALKTVGAIHNYSLAIMKSFNTFMHQEPDNF